ncbi:MAG: RICIN domain-containing protein [Prevotella sp.]|nr:RICIN domain-containing protein [Prevotella sp.]
MKRLAMTLVALTLLMMTATAQTIKEGVYVIKSVSNPNYVLTLKNAQPGDGNPLSVEKWKNNNAQKWKVTIQDGYNVIRSMVDNNYVVDVNNVTPVDGREVYIFGFHGGDNQLWTPKSKGGLKVELLSKADKTFALTMTTDGKTQTWKDAGKNTQVWEFVHPEAMTTTTTTPTTTTSTNVIPDGVYIIKFAKDPNYVVTLKDGKATSQNLVHLWKWRNDNSQKWKVTTQNGKTLIRSMVNNNYVLDVRGGDIRNETRIQVYEYHGGNNQLWVPEKQSNGSIVLMSYANKSFCLDLHYGNPSNDALIKLYQTHKGFEQQWSFQRVDGTTNTNTTTTTNIPNAPTKLTNYRNKVGQTYTFKVTGKKNGRIWGGKNNIYTDDSDIATAAVHAGILKSGKSGTIKVKILADQGSYPSITRNGITSIKYGKWKGAYQILNGTTSTDNTPSITNYELGTGSRNIRVRGLQPLATPVPCEENPRAYSIAPKNLVGFEKYVNKHFYFIVRVNDRPTGTIWGGHLDWFKDKNGKDWCQKYYTLDSDFETAMIHAGNWLQNTFAGHNNTMFPQGSEIGQVFIIQIKIVKASNLKNGYTATRRYGITSKSHAKTDIGFIFTGFASVQKDYDGKRWEQQPVFSDVYLIE